MIFKSIFDKFNLDISKSAARDIRSSKAVSKQKVAPTAPSIAAGGNVSAGGDIIVGNKTIHKHTSSARKSDAQIARSVIKYLDNKRVLTDPSEWEKPHDCVTSVFDIRSRLARILEEQKLGKELDSNVTAMLESCKKFLTATQALDMPHQHIYGSDMRQILDSFRREFAVPVKAIIKRHNISTSDSFSKSLLR